MKAFDLKVEYLTAPIGLDETKPRFYFKNEGGVTQTAYQIKCFVKEELYWDSGKVSSCQNTHIEYQGKPLKEKQRVNFEVVLWDENDVLGEPAKSFFETGLMGKSFEAKWITGNYTPKKNVRYPVDCFRKSFVLDESLSKARIYATAKGVYRLTINHQKMEDFILAPGSTDYRKTLQYQTYDVTKFLKNGENVIEVELADGWYRGSIGCFGKTNVFGRETSFVLELDMEDKEGNRQILSSDETWDWSNDGPIHFADLKDGEDVDASQKASYSGKVKLSKEKNPFEIVASHNVPVEKHEHFEGKVIQSEGNRHLIDFSQNIAGFLAFKVKAKGGERIRVLLGETLDENENFTQVNFQEEKPKEEFGTLTEMLLITGNKKMIHKAMQKTPLQKMEYVCKAGENSYETSFSFFGFRYALVETELDIQTISFESIAVYSSLQKTGEFESSNADLNQLYSNITWSMKNNFLDVPTDCPTRERLGWTGDGQIFFNSAAYLAFAPAFYRKWLRDFRDNQFKSGKVSAVVPYNGVSMVYDNTGSSAGWADAAILIPYRFYKAFNDKRILEDNFEMMKKSVLYMIANCGEQKKDKTNPYPQYIYEKGVHLGEWLEPVEFKDMEGSTSARTINQPEVATAYLHHTLCLYYLILKELNRNDDMALIEKYMKGTREAYNYAFLQDFDYSTTRQAKLVRPIEFGLAQGDTRAKLLKSLSNSVKIRHGKIGTGFLSTAFLLPLLAENGYSEDAYTCLFNEECPGWLYEVKEGATTIWENWENDMKSSKNHYSLGAVAEFLFGQTLGIQVEGENHFTISPKVTNRLSFAKGSFDSIYGKVEVSWKNDEGKAVLEVLVPSNCTAEIVWGEKSQTVSAGKYIFK